MSKIHIPEHQWEKQKRKQRLKNKKQRVKTPKQWRNNSYEDTLEEYEEYTYKIRK